MWFSLASVYCIVVVNKFFFFFFFRGQIQQLTKYTVDRTKEWPFWVTEGTSEGTSFDNEDPEISEHLNTIAQSFEKPNSSCKFTQLNLTQKAHYGPILLTSHCEKFGRYYVWSWFLRRETLEYFLFSEETGVSYSLTGNFVIVISTLHFSFAGPWNSLYLIASSYYCQ